MYDGNDVLSNKFIEVITQIYIITKNIFICFEWHS